MKNLERDKAWIETFIEYEVAGTWWVALVPRGWIQRRVAQYLAKKVVRKYQRYRRRHPLGRAKEIKQLVTTIYQN